MQEIESNIIKSVLEARAGFDAGSFSEDDIIRVLKALSNGESLSETGFAALLSPAATPHLEEIAKLAKTMTAKHFGNSVALFTPLYLANYCQSNCIYCGFSFVNKIKRVQLSFEEVEHELSAIAQSKMQEILLLTGEAPRKSTPEYIAKAAKIASRKFANVGVEVYPMDVEGYQLLQENGVDYVTVFQETYDIERYKLLHLSGEKRNFTYRFNAQERALLGGMRGVAFAALLGIADFRKDAFATGIHAKLIQRKFPHAAISLSCPRLRPATGNDAFIDGVEIAGRKTQSREEELLNPNNTLIHAQDVSEADLLQVICAYRLLLPFANITVSTRESEVFRDNAIKICATKVSAGVDTGIGRHSGEEDGDAQFEIADTRTFEEMVEAIKRVGMQPVVNEHIRLSLDPAS